MTIDVTVTANSNIAPAPFPRDLYEEQLRDIDRFAFTPAVIIGRHADQRIGKLGFAGEASLGHPGHADHIGAPLAVKPRLGLG